MDVFKVLGLFQGGVEGGKPRRSMSLNKEQEEGVAPDSSVCGGKKKRSHRALLSRDKAEPYLTGNPYTLGGFRRCANLSEALDGLWYLHNQSADTWTTIISIFHSAACFVYAIYALDVFSMGIGPACVFTLFWLHVVIHAPASVACHLIGNSGISQAWYQFTLQADYLCIFLASTILSFCLSYWVFSPTVTLAVVAAAILLVVHLIFNLEAVVNDHHQRLICLLGIGNLYQLPLWYQGTSDWLTATSGSPLPFTMMCPLVVFGSLAVGGGVYAFHLPERFAPGYFDMFGSHAIMHVCIQVSHFFQFLFLVHMCLRSQQAGNGGAVWEAY